MPDVILAAGTGTWRRAATALLALLACAAIAQAASAAPHTLVKRDMRTVALRPGRTTTVTVPYPDALEFGGARYSGTVKILLPPPGARGRRPTLRLIKLLSDGPAEGESLFRVRIRNDNPPGTLPARAVIVALTRLPASG